MAPDLRPDSRVRTRDLLLASSRSKMTRTGSRVQHDGFWNEPRYTATGFPRVFYLRYHGYAKFFALWAMARSAILSAAISAS
jgi:hypothetical protein